MKQNKSNSNNKQILESNFVSVFFSRFNLFIYSCGFLFFICKNFKQTKNKTKKFIFSNFVV